MADQPTPENEGAARRIQEERDALKAERDALAAAVKQQGIERAGERYLRDKGVSDPAEIDQWLSVMTPSLTGAEFKDVAELNGIMEQRFGPLVGKAPKAEQPADQPPVDGTTPPRDPSAQPQADAPGFVTPSPIATGGAPPQPDALSPTMTNELGQTVPNPRYWEFANRADPASFKRAVDAGQVVFTPFDAEEKAMIASRGPRGVL